MAAQAVLPAAGPRDDQRHLAEDLLDHALDQVLLAVDVAVQRHRLDAELASEPPHREGVEALAVDEVEGGAEHPIA